MPALPLDEAGKYVAGAYVVFVALLLVYVAIMAVRIDRMREELSELADLARSDPRMQPMAPATKSRAEAPSLPPRWRPRPAAADAKRSSRGR